VRASRHQTQAHGLLLAPAVTTGYEPEYDTDGLDAEEK